MAIRCNHSCVVEFSLQGPWRLGLYVLVIGLLTLLISVETAKIAIVTALGKSPNTAELQKALAIEPDNPALLHRLGLLYSFLPDTMSPLQGVRCLRRAVELNPHRAAYWLSLGTACDSVGDTTCADHAFQRALVLNPTSPRVQWGIGNHYLMTDRVDTALPFFRRLLELSPEYARPTFGLCLRAVHDPQIVYERVLPRRSDAKLRFAFVNLLSEQGDHDNAYRVWRETIAETSAFAFSSVTPYLDRLLGQGRFLEAQSVWQDLERLGIVKKPPTEDPRNLVFNGGFEQDPLNAGFDWRFQSAAYVAADFADTSAFQKERCLRVDFTVSRNDEFEPVYQIAPVVPYQAYVLSAYVRSENVSSDSGPRLRVLDPACPACPNAMTEATVGTTAWHQVTLSFLAGPQTHAVRLSVWRPRSRTFPTDITGSFWLDAVSLTAVAGSEEKTDGRITR